MRVEYTEGSVRVENIGFTVTGENIEVSVRG